MWPFTNKETLRTRASLGDLHTQRQLLQYQGLLTDLLSGPVATARLLFANGLGDSELTGAFSDWVRPTMLSEIGSAIIECGECLYFIDESTATFQPTNGYDIRGGYDERDWSYSLELTGPTGSRTVQVPAAQVLHFRVNVDARHPWRGRSPVDLADATAKLSSHLEIRAGQGASGPEGNVLPYPDMEFGVDDDGNDEASDLQSDINALQGQTALAPSGRDAGVGSPQGVGADYISRRIGYTPPAPLVELRRDVERSMLNACGIPPALHSDSGGTAYREALKGFRSLTIQPLANQVAAELTRKTGSEHTIEARQLGRADLAGAGRALKGLTDAGLSLEQALAIAELSAD